jgi:hypothetical protein
VKADCNQVASLEGKSSLRLALLTSLMIICFEAWNCNVEFAVRQIQTGLRFIREWHEVAAGLRDGHIGSESSCLDSAEDELVRIFSRLDCQVVSFSETPSPERHASLIAKGRRILDQMPPVFTSLSEAGVCEETIVRRAMSFVSNDIPLSKPPPPLHTFPMNGWWGVKDSHILGILENMITDGVRWKAAFEPLWSRLKTEKHQSDLFLAALMRLRVETALFGSTIPCISDEKEYDNYYETFTTMVDLAEYLLEDLVPKWSKSPKFNFDSYSIIPLCLTAQKCRDPLLRRRAISLLFKYPRKEGVWDSLFMGGITEWVLNVEEAFLDHGKVPDWARLHGVTLEIDPYKENRGRLTCQQRVSALSDESVIRETNISWNLSECVTMT